MFNSKFKLWLLLFIVILSVSLACGSSTPGQSNKPAAEPAQSYAVGQDVTVGEVRWKVLEAKDLGKELKSDNQFVEPKKTSGRFVLVRLEVENRKNEAANYAGIDLVDGKGREFQRYPEGFGFIPQEEGCAILSLNPNIVKTCSEIFEVPADASGVKAKLGDLDILGGKEAIVDLGF